MPAPRRRSRGPPRAVSWRVRASCVEAALATRATPPGGGVRGTRRISLGMGQGFGFTGEGRGGTLRLSGGPSASGVGAARRGGNHGGARGSPAVFGASTRSPVQTPCSIVPTIDHSPFWRLTVGDDSRRSNVGRKLRTCSAYPFLVPRRSWHSDQADARTDLASRRGRTGGVRGGMPALSRPSLARVRRRRRPGVSCRGSSVADRHASSPDRLGASRGKTAAVPRSARAKKLVTKKKSTSATSPRKARRGGYRARAGPVHAALAIEPPGSGGRPGRDRPRGSRRTPRCVETRVDAVDARIHPRTRSRPCDARCGR